MHAVLQRRIDVRERRAARVVKMKRELVERNRFASAGISSSTWLGTPTPIVSPMDSSSQPISISLTLTSTTIAGVTSSPNGEPNAVDT